MRTEKSPTATALCTVVHGALGNEAIGCGSVDDGRRSVRSCGYFLALLGDAKRRARERGNAHFNYGAEPEGQKGVKSHEESSL